MIEAEKLMTAAADVLRLKLDPEYGPGVKSHLEVAVKMAALLDAVELDDEAEPAWVYRP
ncbi:MAG: DUF4089 domain-containing protein [Devosia sp.]|jgi:hypothetical protein|uniref:DUF4089 domain-containing protein n=1 Tax=Devosia sp. TaxID=1871048 RepID=UPI0037BF5FC9